MSLSFSASAFLLIVALLAAGAFSFWSYQRTTPTLAAPIRLGLSALRFASLALIILLLFDPSVRRTHVEDRESQLVFLLDNSASVPFIEGEGAAERITQTLNELPSTARSMPASAFDARSRSVGVVDHATDSLTFDGGRTNIAAAIEGLRPDAASPVRAAVLISDGRYNAGRNPLFSAADAPFPVHTVVVGDTSAYVDVVLRDVVTNEIARTGVELPIRARVVAEGFEGQRVSVSVLDGTTRLATAEIDLRGDGTEQTVDLHVTPQTPGLKRYVVHVTELDGEATHRNNARSVTVRVVDSRRQVLVIGGAPDPDIGALRQALSQSEDAEISTRIQRTPDAFYEGTLPTDFSAFDLVVLAGFPAPGTPAAVVNSVRDRITAARRPVLLLAGRRLNAQGLRQLGDDIMPGVPAGSAPARSEVIPRLTTDGARHPVSGTVASPNVWSRLPPVLAVDAAWQLSPDAVVLLEATGQTESAPLLTVRSRGGLRSAAILGADSWRWRTVSPGITDAEDLYDRLVDNLVQWLVSPEDTRLVRVRPSQDQFEGSESVRILGEVYDERLAPLDDAEVEVEITPDVGSSFQLSMTSEGQGRYRLDAGALPEGTYQYTASASREGREIGSDTGSFTVSALVREYQHARADAALMRQIAAQSGGQAVTLAELPALISDLLAGPDLQPQREHIVREASLRHTALFLILIIVLLAAEWVLRKRHGMV